MVEGIYPNSTEHSFVNNATKEFYHFLRHVFHPIKCQPFAKTTFAE